MENEQLDTLKSSPCLWMDSFVFLSVIFAILKINILSFYAPGLKGPPGASSNRIVCPSVCLSVRPSVRLSVRNSVPLTNKVQYLKFG